MTSSARSPRIPFTERITRGEHLLLDGATGSELQRRGVDVLKGSTPDILGAWSATANLDAPAIVRQVHEDYFQVGTDIVTSNSFWTNRLRLEPVGLGDKWRQYCGAAGRLACEARDAVNPSAYVAGGIAPPTMHAVRKKSAPDSELLGRNKFFDLFAEQAATLKEAGVDCILAEYVGWAADGAVAVEACATTGLPVMLGIRHATVDGMLQYDETCQQLADALKGGPVAAVLLMCTPPQNVTATFHRLADAFKGSGVAVGAYPNVGYEPLGPLRGKHVTEVVNTLGTTPGELALEAGTWLALGARIVGGCCGTGPDHIAALKKVVKGE